MDKPSKEEIQKFIECFDKLDQFQAEHRLLRNWSCYEEKDLPIPEVVKVIDWLKKQVKYDR